MNVSDASSSPPVKPQVPKPDAHNIQKAAVASAPEATRTADAVKSAPKSPGTGKVIDISA